MLAAVAFVVLASNGEGSSSGCDQLNKLVGGHLNCSALSESAAGEPGVFSSTSLVSKFCGDLLVYLRRSTLLSPCPFFALPNFDA